MKYELKKIWNMPFLLLCIVCFVVNGYLFYNQQQYTHRDLLQEYDTYLTYLGRLQQDIHLDLASLSNTNSQGGSPGAALYAAEQQQKHILMYPEYIRSLPQRAQAANLLAADGKFTVRNTAKTTADFSGLENRLLQIGPDIALTAVYDFPVTDILLLVFLLMVCVRLFSYEYDRGLFGLVLCNRKRHSTGMNKIFSLFILVFLFAAVLYLINLGIGIRLYGLGSLSRPVQSMDAFRTSSLWLSCGQFLFLGFAMKVACAFGIGLLVFMLLTLLRKASLALLAAAAIAGIELTLYTAVSVTSSANAPHFINLFCFMDSFTLLSRYQNINLLGFPVSVLALFPWVIGILCMLSAGLILWAFIGGAVLRKPRLATFADRLLDGAKRAADRLHCHGSVFLHECRKTLFSRRAGIFFISLLALMLYQYHSFYAVFDNVDRAMQDYVAQIGGRITQDTLDFLQKEELFLQNIPADQQLFYEGRIQAFPVIKMKVETALERERSQGIPAYLVYEEGYMRLMADPGADGQMALLVILFSSLCCAGIFSGENTFQTKKLLRICRGGSRLVYQKISVALILCLLISGTVFLLRFLMIQKSYPLGYANAPIQSMEAFAFYSRHISIGKYLVQQYVLRAAGSIIVSLGILGISSLCRGEAVAVALSAAVFAAPTAAVAAGIDAAKFLSLFPLLSGNAFLEGTRQIPYSLFGALVLLSGVFLIWHCWREGMPRGKIAAAFHAAVRAK